MEIDWRPLNLGEVLDRTIQIYRSRFRMFVGIMSVGAGCLLLMQGSQLLLMRLLKAGDRPHPAILIVFGLLFLCLAFIAIVVFIVGFAAVFRAVADMYTGVPTGVVRAYSAVWGNWFRYLRLYVLLGMIGAAPLVVPIIALFAIAFGAAHVRAVAGIGGLGALFVIAGLAIAGGLVLSVWLGLRYSLSGSACVFENIGIVQSLRRSAILSRGQRWRIVILVLLMLTIQSVVLGLFMVPAFPFLILHPRGAPIIVAVAVLLGSAVARVLAEPIVWIGWMVCYFDARIRREGFDVEWRLQRSAATSALTEANPDEVPPALPPPEITGLNPA